MKITRRLIIFVLAPLLLIVISGSVLAASSDNPIWSGLWSGSNFDVSHVFGGSDKPQPNSSGASNPPKQKTYAALGDSVAAGQGLATLAHATSSDTQCGRSAQAYPQLIAVSHDFKLTYLACSGATAGDLVTKQRVSGPNVPAQLDVAYAHGTPNLITITAGANDAHWVSFLQTCYTTNCDRESTRLLAQSYLSILDAKLNYMFHSIDARSGGTPPKVIVTGYYNPLSTECLNVTNRLTQNELTWFDSEVTALNSLLEQTTAKYAFATFVPVDFSGHDICSSRPWIQGPSDPAPFHPNAQGQQIIAASIENAL
jgi:lysophospholipase L1-like esterase